MQKRVLIIYTGGTIGMRSSPGGYLPDAGLVELLPVALPALLEGEIPIYEVRQYPQLIDSANLRPADWTRIAIDIVGAYDDYDGFVVLHGTDTMAYTASALSFMLAGLRKPVIVTGSQIPLGEHRNDARNNLLTALLLAAQYPVPEVTLYFNGRLIRGNRSTKVQAEGFDAFDSPNYPLLGRVGIRFDIDYGEVLARAGAECFATPDYSRALVRVLQVYPGMDAGTVEAMTRRAPGGLILRTYGVGNAPVTDAAVLASLQAAVRAGSVVVNVSQCLYGRVDMRQYATGMALTEIGVISGFDMTTEAAFSKLTHLLALGLDAAEIRARMQEDLCGELSVPGAHPE